MARFVDVYAYDENGQYIGTTLAQRDKNGSVMVPADATDIEPLEPKEGFVVCFNKKDSVWEHVELTADVEEPEAEPEELTYKEKRLAEYPFLGDQLDAIFKGFKSLQDSGTELPDETANWLNEVDSIKTKYPKASLDG